MQAEPIQFGAVGAPLARRSAVGIARSIRGGRKSAGQTSNSTVLDAAFADYSRVDTGALPNEAAAKSVPANLQSVTQDLISKIATQLETLDGQRRQLARLLKDVNSDATV